MKTSPKKTTKAAAAKPQRLKIVKNDPWLEPYADIIEARNLPTATCISVCIRQKRAG